MAKVYLNRARVTASTSGLSGFTLGSADPGYRTFADAGAVDGDEVSYLAYLSQTEWEIGVGVYQASGPTLTRETIRASTNAGAKVNFTAAPVVGPVAAGEDIDDIWDVIAPVAPPPAISSRDRLLGQSFLFAASPNYLTTLYRDGEYPTVRVERGWGTGDYADLFPAPDGKLYIQKSGAGILASTWADSEKLLVEHIYNQVDGTYISPLSADLRVLLDLGVETSPAFAGYSTGTQDANQHATQRGYALPDSITWQSNDHLFSSIMVHHHYNVGGQTINPLQDDTDGASHVWRMETSPLRQYIPGEGAVMDLLQNDVPSVSSMWMVNDGRGLATEYTLRMAENGVMTSSHTTRNSEANEWAFNLFGPVNSLRGRCYAVMITDSALPKDAMTFSGIPSKLAPVFTSRIATDKPSIAFPYTRATIPMDLGTETADIPVKLFGKPSTEYEAQWQAGGYANIGTSDANGVLDGALTGQVAGRGTLDVREVGGSTPVSITLVGVGIILFVLGGSDTDGRGEIIDADIPYGSALTLEGVSLTLKAGVDTTTIAAGGTGYSVGDDLTLVGGTGTAAVYNVDSVGGSGEVTSVTRIAASTGAYTAVPSNPVSTTGGAGSGCTLDVNTWGFGNSWYWTLVNYLYGLYSCVILPVVAAAGSTGFYYPNTDTEGEWSVTPESAPAMAALAKRNALGQNLEFLAPNICFWGDQGRGDANRLVTGEQYKERFIALMDNLRQEIRSDLECWCALSGPNAGVPAAQTDVIRQAQKELWAETHFNAMGSFAHLIPGPDGVHLDTEAQKEAARDIFLRHWTGSGRAPQYASAVVDGADLDVTFTGGVSPLTIASVLATDAAGWSITDGSGARTITGVSVATLVVTLTCDQALAGTVTFSFCSGESGQGTTLLDSDATTPLPPEPFSASVAA